jgi:hypothetical protein
MWSDYAESISERGSSVSGDLFREPQTCVSPRTKGRCPVCLSLAAYECAYCIMPSSSLFFGYLRTSFQLQRPVSWNELVRRVDDTESRSGVVMGRGWGFGASKNKTDHED